MADYLRLLCAAAIWGSTFICNDIALKDFSPLAIAAYRVILAAFVLLVCCYWQGQRIELNLRTVTLLTAIGMMNSVLPFTLIAWGQISVDSSTTGILLATSPFAALLLSHMMTKDDRFSWQKLLGLTLGFMGICVLFSRGVQQGDGSIPGMLAIMLAGCCYALSSVLIRRLGSLPSLVLAAGSLFSVAALMLPVLLFLDPPWQQSYSGGGSIAALLFLAIGPTAVGYVLRAQIVKNNGAVFMSNVGYLIPVFAVLWAWLLFNQRPSSSMLVALIMILAGVALGQSKLKRWLRL